jgi:hypothetical protein
MTELSSGPPKRERRAYPNPVFSPPQELGYPGQRTALAVSWSGRGAPQKRQGQLRALVPAGYLPYQRYRWSRLISLLASVFTAARVWSSTTRQTIATRLPFNYPRTSYSRWSPRFVLWPPGELPVSQSAGHPHAGASCSRHGRGVMLATSGPVSRALGGVESSPC